MNSEETHEDKGYSCEEYKTFVVDLCKEEEYTDSNGVTWWGEHYRGNPDILKLYKGLVGQSKWGITVTEVFQEENIIKAFVQSVGEI